MFQCVENKTALVTGASRGIGKGIALVLAKEGYDLAITYATKKEEAGEVAHKIREEYGRKCVVFHAQMEDPDVPGELVKYAVSELGRLDVLVNNAGLSSRDEILTVGPEKLDLIMNLDFRGPVLAMKAAANHMVEKGIKGSIVNITSTRAERAYPNDFLYGAAKAALTRATQSIAMELAPYGIRVNCVAPGATAIRPDREEFYEALGKKIPLARMGTPEDDGHAVVWLVSDKASYITGITIKVDGGLILPGMPEDIRPEAGYGWGEIRR